MVEFVFVEEHAISGHNDFNGKISLKKKNKLSGVYDEICFDFTRFRTMKLCFGTLLSQKVSDSVITSNNMIGIRHNEFINLDARIDGDFVVFISVGLEFKFYKDILIKIKNIIEEIDKNIRLHKEFWDSMGDFEIEDVDEDYFNNE